MDFMLEYSVFYAKFKESAFYKKIFIIWLGNMDRMLYFIHVN